MVRRKSRMADKKGRVQEIIQRNLSEIIIYDMKNDLTKYASINEVHVTSDYYYCKVYVSHINPEKSDDLVNYLNNRAGKIRTMLANKISIYKTPALIFVKDTLFEKGQAMDDLIDHALNQKPMTLKDLDKIEKDNAKKERKDISMKKKVVKKKVAAKKPVAKKATAKKATKKTATKKA